MGSSGASGNTSRMSIDARAPSSLAEYVAAVGGLASVLQGDEPGGKAAALNAAVRAATSELLVFADSRQHFAPEAVSRLVDALGDERLGAVSGAVVNDSGDPLMDRYWTYELALRESQAAVLPCMPSRASWKRSSQVASSAPAWS